MRNSKIRQYILRVNIHVLKHSAQFTVCFLAGCPYMILLLYFDLRAADAFVIIGPLILQGRDILSIHSNLLSASEVLLADLFILIVTFFEGF
jgi:hypothetical protein